MKLLLFFLGTIPGVLFANQFSDYWYAGKAEVAVYDLEQSRYGLLRKGTSSLIFVTEPFSKKKHVKLDNPSSVPSDKITVLKLNKTKKYNTGIYPYSVMTSTFAEVNSGKALKANTSIQEWCGHAFLQANWVSGSKYSYRGYSYFESEGDHSGALKNTVLEEELMLAIRLGTLDVSSVSHVTPLQELSRLLHFPYKPTEAELSTKVKGDQTTLKVVFDHPAKLVSEITYQTAFPHIIQGWCEQYEQDGHTYTTTARLKTVQQLPYWQMNAPQYEKMRKGIGLE